MANAMPYYFPAFRARAAATLLVLGLLNEGGPLRADDAAVDGSPEKRSAKSRGPAAGEVRIARTLYAETAR